MIKKLKKILYTYAFLLSLQTGYIFPAEQSQAMQVGQRLQKRSRPSIFDTVSDQEETAVNQTTNDATIKSNNNNEAAAKNEQQAVKQDVNLLEQTGDPTLQFSSATGQGINRFIQEAIAEPAEESPDTPTSLEITTKDKKPSEEPAKPVPAKIETAQPEQEETPTEIIDPIGEYPGQETEQEQNVFDAFHQPKEIMLQKEHEDRQKESSKKEDLEQEHKKAAIDDDLIEFYFEDADIQNLLTQVADIYNVNFITDETIDPLGPGGKALKGNKISFKTHKPLNKKAAWNLFLTFLDLAGFALVPESEQGFYRVVTADKAQKSPVPAYIGVEPETLPDNDQVVRFVYFIENAEINTIKDIVNTLKSPNARAVILQEIKALVITDKAYNIKSLMQIIQELDQVSMPQSMSVLKLERADVMDVKKLYDTISKPDGEGAAPSRLFGARKQSASIYFPENARLIAEPRSNSLILLGPKDAIKKIEDFIMKYVDVELEKPYSPLHTYQLRYASAVTVSDIMNNMSQFGSETAAGKAGGVRGGDKYLKPMSFTAEPATNTVVIKGDYEDYLKALEIIKKLDEPQPQVAVEALILTLNFEDNKEVGSQIRNKVPGPNGLLGNNVDFQTSGIRLGGSAKGIQTNPNGPGADRLLANLINLVSGAGAGNTVFSLGADAFGVWGIFNILQSITNTQVVSNPFLVATNKTKASVAIGEIRRVVTSTIFAGETPADALGDFSAELKLEVTPQINSDGMIILKLNVLFENFISSLQNNEEAAKQTRTIDTKTIVADREVIAIGGLIQNRIIETLSKVPILGDIPILGWLFRNKGKRVVKDNLLILISTRIIEPEVTEIVDEHTQQKMEDYYETVETFHDSGEYRDPVYRRFFDDQQEAPADVVEDFLFKRRVTEESSAEEEIEKIEDQKIDLKVTRNGKFYRPGKAKAPAIIKQPELEKEPPPTAPANQSLYRSGLLKQLTEQPDTLQISQNNKKSRRRDARRSLQHLMPNDQIGVIT
jgi:general secretion pathway protein D